MSEPRRSRARVWAINAYRQATGPVTARFSLNFVFVHFTDSVGCPWWGWVWVAARVEYHGSMFPDFKASRARIVDNSESAAMVLLLLGVPLSTWAFTIFPPLFIVYWIVWIVYCRTIHPLASIPGPFWPSVSRTWLMYHTYKGKLEVAERHLHARYGPIVRIAHDEISTSEVSAIPKIYPTQQPLPKTDFYPTYRPIGISHRPDTFTVTDEVEHANHRRIVNPVYKMGSILKNESAMDECLNWLIKRLGEHADRREVMDIGHWLEMYSVIATPSKIVDVKAILIVL